MKSKSENELYEYFRQQSPVTQADEMLQKAFRPQTGGKALKYFIPAGIAAVLLLSVWIMWEKPQPVGHTENIPPQDTASQHPGKPATLPERHTSIASGPIQRSLFTAPVSFPGAVNRPEEKQPEPLPALEREIVQESPDFKYLLLTADELKRLGIQASPKNIEFRFHYPWLDGACLEFDYSSRKRITNFLGHCDGKQLGSGAGKTHAAPLLYAQNPSSSNFQAPGSRWDFMSFHALFFINNENDAVAIKREATAWLQGNTIIAGFKLKTDLLTDTLGEQLVLFAFPRTEVFYKQLEPETAQLLRQEFGVVDTSVYRQFFDKLNASVNRQIQRRSYWTLQPDSFYYPDKAFWKQLQFTFHNKKLNGSFFTPDSQRLNIQIGYGGTSVYSRSPVAPGNNPHPRPELLPRFSIRSKNSHDTVWNSDMQRIYRERGDSAQFDYSQDEYVFVVAGFTSPHWYNFMRPGWYHDHDTTLLAFKRSPLIDSLLRNQPLGTGFRPGQNPFQDRSGASSNSKNGYTTNPYHWTSREKNESSWYFHPDSLYYPDLEVWEKLEMKSRKRHLKGEMFYLQEDYLSCDTQWLKLDFHPGGSILEIKNTCIADGQERIPLRPEFVNPELVPVFAADVPSQPDSVGNTHFTYLRLHDFYRHGSRTYPKLDSLSITDYVFLSVGKKKRNSSQRVLVYKRTPELMKLLEGQPKGTGFRRKQNPFRS